MPKKESLIEKLQRLTPKLEKLTNLFPIHWGERIVSQTGPALAVEYFKHKRGVDSHFPGKRLLQAILGGQRVSGQETLEASGITETPQYQAYEEGREKKKAILREKGMPEWLVGLHTPTVAAEIYNAALDPTMYALMGTKPGTVGKHLRSAGEALNLANKDNLLRKLTSKRRRIADIAYKITKKQAGLKPKTGLQQMAKRAGLSTTAPGIPVGTAGMRQKEVFETMLKRFGMDTTKIKPPTLLSNFQNPVEMLDKMDQQAGTITGMSPMILEGQKNYAKHFKQSMLKNVVNPFRKELKRLGISDQRFNEMLRGERSIPDRVRHLVAKAQQIDATLLARKRRYGFPVKEHPNYIATRRRSLIPVDTGKREVQARQILSKQKGQRYREAGFIKSRAKTSPLPEQAYSRNFTDRVLQDVDEVVSAALFQPKNINHFKKQMAILQLEGATGKAEQLGTWVTDITGFKTNPKYSVFVNNIMSDGTKNVITKVQEIAKFSDIDTGRRFLESLNKIMFSVWVGLNPISLTKQWGLQMPTVGAAEIGTKATARGIAMVSGQKVSPRLKKMANRMLKHTRPPGGPEWLEKGLQVAPKGKASQQIDKYTRAALKGFTKGDLRNVRGMFYGAADDILTRGMSDKILEGLLPSQALYVKEGFKLKGLEEAAYRYGLIRTLRINYMYSIVDKPSALRNMFGELVPFTTWGRNQVMRFMGNVNASNYKTVAKRLAYPLVLLEMIEALTGHKVPGAHPAQAALNVLDVGPVPAVKGVTSALGQGKPVRAAKRAASLVPGYRFYARAKKGKSFPEILGYKKVK